MNASELSIALHTLRNAVLNATHDKQPPITIVIDNYLAGRSIGEALAEQGYAPPQTLNDIRLGRLNEVTFAGIVIRWPHPK